MNELSPTENLLYYPNLAFSANAAIPDLDAYQTLCQEAQQDYPAFWARLAKQTLSWYQPFTQILDETEAPFYHWFSDGKLNASYNCLDRHIEAGQGNKIAIICESDSGEVGRCTDGFDGRCDSPAAHAAVRKFS